MAPSVDRRRRRLRARGRVVDLFHTSSVRVVKIGLHYCTTLYEQRYIGGCTPKVFF